MLRCDDWTSVTNIVSLVANNLYSARIDTLYRLLGHGVSEDDDSFDFGHGIGVEIFGSVVNGISALRVSTQHKLRVWTIGNCALDNVGPV